MTPSGNILWGNIIKVHGLKGEMMVQAFSDDLSEYKTLESVFVEIRQKQIPFFISSFAMSTQKRCIISFDDINTLEQAKALVGCDLYIPLERVAEGDESRMYYQSVVGYKVFDQKLGELGVISDFFQKTGQDLLMMEYKGVEVLIPVNEHIVIAIYADKQEVETCLPEGLLEVYVNNDSSEEEREEESEEEETDEN